MSPVSHCVTLISDSVLTLPPLRVRHGVRDVGVGVHGQEGGLALGPQEGEDRHSQAQPAHHHQCELHR